MRVRLKYPTTLLVVIISIGILATATSVSAASAPPRPGAHHQVKSYLSTTSPDAALTVPGLSAALAEQEYLATVTYLQAVHDSEVREVVEYLQAQAAQEAQAVQAYADAMARQKTVVQSAPAQTQAPSTYSGSGSCYGGPIPDYIVTRESGGNPNAQNPSGAWGCYQIMPEWWSGACSGFDKYSIDGQKACAAILWNGGAGSSNWALTR